ncbi:sodium-dependent phosphate transport protein 4 isoform X1 [Lemur catta]|uniref:sodium-dependent phosphate transport protein 4 isoform X1 n=2 Tax=Lemur catta TaxID=9447 RepID=UPI001E26DDFB|nr:sodium-dependent phosphate transport protein 4 isoform X1 [Lemur catta]
MVKTIHQERRNVMATMTELSPIEGENKYSQDMQVDKKFIPSKVPGLCSTRYGLAFTLHFCNLSLVTQNIVMYITMVAMVNSTDHQSQLNSSTEGLPIDSFGGPNNTPKSLPARAPVYDWSPQVQGIIFSSLSYGMILTLGLSGYLAGRIGTKRVFGFSLFVSSLLTLCTPLAVDFGLTTLIVTRVVHGLSQGSGFGGQFAVWEKWSLPHERSRLCTIALSGMALGSFTALLTGGFITQAIGWPFAFYIFGGIGCVFCLLWFVLVYDDPASHPWISTSEKEYIVSSLDQQVSSFKEPLPIKAIFRSLPFWSICICSFGHNWLLITIVVYTPTYISSVHNVNIRDNGILSAFPFLCAWAIGIMGGWLADFLLSKNFRLITVRKIATVLGNLPASAFVVALPYLNSNYITTVTFLTLSCVLSQFCQSGVYINSLDIAPRYSSFLIGLSRQLSYIASILVPMITGFFLSQDPEFGWKNTFFLLFGVNLFGLIFYIIFGEADIQDWAKERKLTRL